MIDTDSRNLIERMCACLHNWSVLWGPPANSPTRLLVDKARRYLAQFEFKPPRLKKQALKEMDKLDEQWEVLPIDLDSLDAIRKALEALPDE
jgi:hypothetical protein